MLNLLLSLSGCLYYFTIAVFLLWWLCRGWRPPKKSEWNLMCIPRRGTLVKGRKVFWRKHGPDPDGAVRVFYERARASWIIRRRIGRRVLGGQRELMEAWDQAVSFALARLVKVIPPGSALGWVQTHTPLDATLIVGAESVLLKAPARLRFSAAGHELVHCAQEVRWQCLTRSWGVPPKTLRFGELLWCELQAFFWFPLVPMVWAGVFSLLFAIPLLPLFR